MDLLNLPFAQLLGIELVSTSPDSIVAEITVRPDLCTSGATMHGGAIMANLKEGAGTTTIESKTNFVTAAPIGSRVRGETTPIHRGRRTMVWQTRITLPNGKLVALVTQTQLIL